jgi:hypothetical protein
MVLYTLCKLASLSGPPLPSGFRRHRCWIPHQLLPTDEERDAAHLASAADLHELEFRIQELDRPDRQKRGPFHRMRRSGSGTGIRRRLRSSDGTVRSREPCSTLSTAIR